MFSTATKDLVKRRLPKAAIYFIRNRSLRAAHRYDRAKYLQFSSSIRPDLTKENLAAWVTMLYHNVEKGLSLPEPRPKFGEAAVARLVEHVDIYLDRFGPDEVTEFAVGALRGYADFNVRAGVASSDIPSMPDIQRLDTLDASEVRRYK